MSTSRYNRTPLIFGACGIASVVVIAVVITLLSRANFGKHIYRAELAQTAGLTAGESVEVAGVPVGKVLSLQVDGQHVVATFSINDSITMGSGTTAAVQVATLLGTHFLQVNPIDGGSLPNGTIPLGQTQVPFSLQDVLNGTTHQLEQLNSPLLARSLDAIAQTLKAASPDLGPALDGISRFSRVITSHDAQFQQLLDASKSVTQQFADSGGQLVRLIDSGNLLLGEIQKRRTAIHLLLQNVSALSTTVEGLIHDIGGQLTPTLNNIHEVMDILKRNDAALAATMHAIAVSSRYSANATANGPWLDLYVPDGNIDALKCAEGRC